jgi:hypothetical protein
MTATPAPLPSEGGSWTRDESGALHRTEEAPVKTPRKPDPDRKED